MTKKQAIADFNAINPPHSVSVGDHVEAGDSAEDYDHGRVSSVDGDMITVAWEQSLTRSEIKADGVRPYGTRVL